MLNHEPHETHERWRKVGAFGVYAGPASNPRLRRALGALPQGWPSSEPTLQASPFVGFVWFVVTLLCLVPAQGAARSRAMRSPAVDNMRLTFVAEECGDIRIQCPIVKEACHG